ncbi:10784_t:CDS:2 [Entrophospora sp. SA101]|nr:10784_t:CDS:2 [Entrophospora sp. SA101]
MNGILIRSLKKISDSGSKFYKGGFDPKMNKREAALILGLRIPSAMISTFTSLLPTACNVTTPLISPDFFGGFSGSRRTLGISLNSPKRPFYHDNNSGSSISSIDGKDSEDEHQQKQKPK